MTDALARGEPVPGGPGACASCWHLTLWHGTTSRYKDQPCQLCDCPAFTTPADHCPKPRPQRPRRSPAKAGLIPAGELVLFGLDEVA